MRQTTHSGHLHLESAVVLVWMLMLVFPTGLMAAPMVETMTLSKAVHRALSASLNLKTSQKRIEAAVDAKKAQRTAFFPLFTSTYSTQYVDDQVSFSPAVPTASNFEYTFTAGFSQPLFTGFRLENSYALTKIGVDIASVNDRILRQDIVLRVKQAYFSYLKFEKLLDVARQRVTQIEKQKGVAENFYRVGMTPMNDLLQAQVELADARQGLTVAKNNLEIAASNFNTLLRLPLDTAIRLEDILEYAPFIYDLSYCLKAAEEHRLENKIAELEIRVAEKQIDAEKSGFYPSVNFQANYFRLGDDVLVNGGDGIADPNGWRLAAVASWNFWEWRKTEHNVNGKRRQLSQSRYNAEDVADRIRLEVKQAYLRTKEAEQNIDANKTAIEQARENLRINQERYKEQVATSTDVLIAQTLLTQTMTNYYNALYDFHLSKASLYRSMGLDELE